MRVALKIAYVGTGYHGSQVQPDVATIEGELFNALTQLEIIEDPKTARFSSSGRTDAGVHAREQVVAFDTDKPNLAIPRVINSKLPNSIWAWAHAEVPDDFDPRRWAISRKYRYIMSGEQYDIAKIRAASKLLVGEHDFANFCTKEGDKSTIRNVEKIDVRVSGTLTKIDIQANSFLWNMVRKIVTALTMVGSEVRDEEWLMQMLEPESYEEGLESSAAYGLTLMEVEYPEPIDWCEDAYAIRRATDNVHDYLVRHRVMAEVMDHLVPNE
ncbi:pseudouridylate synthase I [Methanolobus tindarius DSM 2278]|uniref:tRNA pseudouridine synthase A n=1 Tax=Methanolobus tindarius DSM 2278 TaxID=1090322 RepID=W9DNX9_METTI|nr:tRNA pseudouridine(38-40) synthase TruA [Methanolobus tindarius]ETA67889.1 pseudouridylate synthase I [Methanolobus tindarius DSM 2278]